MRQFKDRIDAGKQLADALMSYKDKADTIILALPRGGVPIACEIAKALNLPMTVFLVRKLGVPGHEELAMGAIAEGGICVFNAGLLTQLDISEQQIEAIIHKEKKELSRRLQLYRAGKSLPDIHNKTVILIDDGIATGATTKAAINMLKTLKPKQIVLATPVASRESLKELSRLVNRVFCLMTPEPFYGVGGWYQHFDQTSDEEVLILLKDISEKIAEVKHET